MVMASRVRRAQALLVPSWREQMKGAVDGECPVRTKLGAASSASAAGETNFIPTVHAGLSPEKESRAVF